MGSPWQIPLNGQINPFGSPFMRMEYVLVVMHIIMRELHHS